MTQLDAEKLLLVEADSFWCLTKLLDGIQDNYTFAQPGIQRSVAKMKELINRIDGMFLLLTWWSLPLANFGGVSPRFPKYHSP